MRSSSYLSLAAAAIFLLVLSRAMDQAEAIRLDAETRASVGGGGSSSSQTTVVKPIDNVVAKDSTTTSVGDTKRTSSAAVAAEVRAVAHKLPEFHEDYYGPSDHSPRHH